MNDTIIKVIGTTANNVSINNTTREIALEEATEQIMLTPDFFKMTPAEMSSVILSVSQQVVSRYNATLDKSQAALKWAMPKSVEPFQIVMCLIKRNNAINVVYVQDDNNNSDIALYNEKEGIYTVNTDEINREIYLYNKALNKAGIEEVNSKLRAFAPHRTRTTDIDLIPVNNGIFNYKTKQLMPFSPEYVFLTKSRTDYNSNAQNVFIKNADGSTWDVESWMEDLTDDPEITNLFWEITGALLRPNVAWDKSAWLYSDKGENGKGTLCAMWRNLCGSAATSIPIADFAKDFMLSSLITSQAVIVDENDVGTFIEKAGALKAVITNDTIYVNRKFKDPVAYQFHGFMVQCLNELPRFKDKSDSIYRRQLFIPMSKCFTGIANTDIKKDYINRPDVLEYVMKRVFDMDYYKLSEPDACKLVLEEYKTYNDPVRQFWNEFEDKFVWDLVPFSFLYDLFKEWFKRDNPSGLIMGRNTFIKDIKNVVSKSTVFSVQEDKMRVSNRMDNTETLIYEYRLVNWATQGHSNFNSSETVEAMCHPNVRDAKFNGVIRK